MDGVWTFDRVNKRKLDELVKQLNKLFGRHNLAVHKLQTASFIDKPRPQQSWENLQEDVHVRTGGRGSLVIPAQGWFDIWLKPLKHNGKAYASEVAIKGDHVSLYTAHLDGKPEVVVETHYTITVSPRR